MNKVRYSDRYFEGSASSIGDGRGAVRGVAVTLSSQSVKFILQFGSIIILARLLTPNDFGLVAMVSVFVNFLNMFKDFGLSQAVIQSKIINRGQVSSLFWINIGICVCISLLMFVIAPTIAKFYGREELVSVTMLLGGGIALQSVGLQHRALLIRTMQFGKVEIVEVLSMLGALSVAAALAIYGYTYWALVWQAVSHALILSVGYVIACRWLPGRFTSFRECLHLLRFGGGMFSFNLVNYFSRNADHILVGKFLGAGALGVYVKAYQVLRLPMQQVTAPITKVVFPTLSRLQDAPTKFRIHYLQFLRAITVINVPIVIYLWFFSDVIVEVVLGHQWLEMIPVFRCLAPAALMAATNVAGGWVLVALGQVSKQFYMGLGSSIVHVLAMIVGIRWGIIGLAISVSLSRMIMKLPMLAIAYQSTEINLMDFIRVQFWPMLTSIVAGFAAWSICILCEVNQIHLLLLFSLMIYGIVYLTLVTLDAKIRSELISLKKMYMAK